MNGGLLERAMIGPGGPGRVLPPEAVELLVAVGAHLRLVISDVHGDLPVLAAAGAGSPHARFAVVDDVSGRWEVSFHAVGYPWEEAALMAVGFGRPDVAAALRTGRVAW